MLYLSRKLNQTVIIGDKIKVTVKAMQNGRVLLGFDAPKLVAIDREEIFIQKRERKHSNDNSFKFLNNHK